MQTLQDIYHDVCISHGAVEKKKSTEEKAEKKRKNTQKE